MFGIGELVLQAWLAGFLLFACAAIAGYLIYWSLSRRGWETLSGAAQSPLPASRNEATMPGAD
jgi:hypothetical protein